MDRYPRRESEPTFDFLDEDAKVFFEIEADASRHLPIITSEDALSGRERFCVLLGTTRFVGPDKAHVLVRGIYQENEEDEYGTYREGIEQVVFVPKAIRERVSAVQRAHVDLKDFHYLGETHTHPNGIAKPSQADLEVAVIQYNDGFATADKPYIFGIVGKAVGGEQEYNFFRLVRIPGGYGYKQLEI
jgi:hypothetical protein